MENLPQKLFTVGQAAERLNVSTKTLRRWDKKGALTPLRTSGNQRRYTLEQINNYKSPLVVSSLRPEILVTSRNSSTSAKYLRPVLAVLILCAIGGLTVFFQGKSKNLLCRFKSPLSKLDITASCQNPLPIISQNETLPMVLSGEDVLSEKSSSSDFVFNVNVPANFKEGATFNHDISAPNIINSITAGSGITVSGSKQNPTIANSGVLSLQGSTGALSFTAGSGISISGLTITNSGITSLTAGSGISVSGSTITNSDTGSGQKIFKTISVSGQSDIAVGSNTDTLTFASGTGITLTTDATNKKVTVTGVGGDLNVSGWTDNGTTIWLTTSTDNVGIGTSSPAYKLDLAGTLGVSGIAYFGGNVGIGTTRPTSTLYVTGTQTVTDAVTFGSTLAVTGTSSLNAINNNSGGITNAGPVTGATGLTSSGTITFSGLSTGIVHANFNGVLTSSAVNLTNGDVTGTLPITSGGTNLTSYLKGNLIYASANDTLANLGIGGSGQVLTVSSGVPAWATAVGSEFCPTCLINNPGSTQTVTPTNENATGLSIKQVSGGLVDIFNVTSFDGATKYFKVNSSGNVIVASLGIGSSGTLTSSALTTQRTWTFPNATGNICLDTGNCSGIGSNLGGSGTANYITRWNAQYVLEDSSIYDNGNIGLGTTNPTSKLYVAGSMYATGSLSIGSSFGVTGLADFDSTLSVAGAVDMNSTLGVTGDTTLSSALGVTGNITGGGVLKINGLANSWILGNVGIGTISPLASLNIGSTAAQDLFRVDDNGDNDTTPFLIDQNGNVGIGTTALSSYALNVSGSINVGTSGTFNALGITSAGLVTNLNADMLDSYHASSFLQVGSTGAFVTGSGTPNFLPKFTASTVLGNSLLYDNGTILGTSANVGIGNTAPITLFSVGSNPAVPALAVTSSGNVGIGTTNPLGLLDLSTSNTDTFLRITNAQNRSITLTNNDAVSNAPWVWNTADQWDFQTDTISRIFIKDDGNVGIGTTAPTQKLDVNGSLNVGGTAYVTGFRLNSGGALGRIMQSTDSLGSANWATLTAGTGIGITNVAGTITIYNSLGIGATVTYTAGSGLTLASSTFKLGGALTENTRLNIGNTEVMYLSYPSGNIGIGTTSPTYKLDILGSNPGLRITDNTISNISAGSLQAKLDFNGLYSSGDPTPVNNASIRLYKEAGDGIQAGGLAFWTNNAGTLAERLRISAAGNVGIGTTVPTATLHVLGSGYVTGSLNVGVGITSPLADLGSIRIGGTNVGLNTDTDLLSFASGVLTVNGTLNTASLAIGSSAKVTNLNADYLDGISSEYFLQIGATGAFISGGGTPNFIPKFNAQRVIGNSLLYDNGTILGTSANVGIGTTSPSYKFELLGNDNNYLASINNGNTGASAGGLYIRIDGTGNLLTLNYAGSDIVTVSQAQATFNVPSAFTGSGDVSIANDLVFTDQTSSFIKTDAPLTIDVGENFESNDLTLRTYNAGNIILESANLWADGTNVGIGNTSPVATLHTIGTGIFSGNVGIGTTALSSYALNVNGSINVGTSGTFNALGIASTGLITNLNADMLDSLHSTSFVGTGQTAGFEQILTFNNGLTRTANTVRLGGASALLETTAINQGVYHFGFQGTGNVGIGTTAPTQKLDITSGNINVGGTAYVTGFRLNSGGALGRIMQSTDNLGSANWATLTAGTGIGITNIAGTITIYNSVGVGATVTYTAGSGLTLATSTFKLGGVLSENTRLNIGNTEVMYLSYPSGNVGIGNTSPTAGYKLDVTGNLNVSGSINVGSSGTFNALGVTSTGLVSNLNADYLDGLHSTSFVGTGQTAGFITGSGTPNFLPKWTLASVQGNSLLYDNGTILGTSANVGIGTTVPTTKLHVVGGGYITGSLNVGVGTTTPYLSVGTSASFNAISITSTGLVTNLNADYLDGLHSTSFVGTGQTAGFEQILTFTSGLTRTGNDIHLGGATALTENTAINQGVYHFGFQGTGNVGIGTTLPSYKFELLGNDNNYLASINNGNTGASAGGLYIRSDGEAEILRLNSDGSDIYTFSPTQAVFNAPTNFTSSGDVSIAYDINFTNPTASYIKSDAPLYLEAGKNYNSDDLTLRTYNAGNIIFESANLWADGTNVGIGNTSPIATLHTIGTGIFSGNVGIGTTALSSYALNINGNLNVGGTGIFSTLKLSGAFLDSANQPGSSNMILTSTGTGTTWVSAVGIGGTYTAGNGLTLTSSQFKLGGALTENTRLNIGNTEVMYVSYPSGNVGIGTTNPLGLFMVGSGVGNTSQMIVTSIGRVGIGHTNPQTSLALGNLPTTTGTGLIVDADGNVYKTSSSRRYKDNIENFSTDFDKILEAQPVSFNYKATGAKDIGFIAEDFDSLGLNDLVIYDNQNQPEAIKYDRISLYLLEIVKKQKEQIASISAQLQTLKIQDVSTQYPVGNVGLGLESPDATVSGTLMVLGKSTFGEVGITGQIISGVLSINGLDNTGNASISTLSGPLKLQANALGNLEIMDGQVLIDTKGNLVVQGTITAKKFNVDESDVLSASIGEGLIKAGKLFTLIETTAASESSRIFLSPKEEAVALATSEQKKGSFAVIIGKILTKDLKFSWWVIN